MLKAIAKNVPPLTGSPLAPLNFAHSYSLNSTINNPFQTNTKLNVIANPCQTLYQPHTAPNIGPPAILPS